MKKKCPVLRFFKLVKIENENPFFPIPITKLIVVVEKYSVFCFKLKWNAYICLADVKYNCKMGEDNPRSTSEISGFIPSVRSPDGRGNREARPKLS